MNFLSESNEPSAPPQFSGAVIDPESSRVVGTQRDIAAWLNTSDMAIKIRLDKGLIRFYAPRYLDAEDARNAMAQRSKRGPKTLTQPDGK